MRSLTVRQRQVLDYIADTLRTKGYGPSLAEIGEQFHLSSLATVHKHITNLTEKGYVRRRWNCSRSIEIVQKIDGSCPTCGRVITADVVEAL